MLKWGMDERFRITALAEVEPDERQGRKVDGNTSIATVLQLNLPMRDAVAYCPSWNDKDLGGFFGSKEHLLALGEALQMSGH